MLDEPNRLDDPNRYVLTHTMLRIKDPKRSLEFYQKVLGMSLISWLDFDEGGFTLFFLQPGGNADGAAPSLAEVFSRPGLLELTHNWGTEQDDEPMHSGNEEPKGYGHICIAVPDIEAACARFDRLGVTFQKELGHGGMKDIAFIKDPDGYWIEIVQPSLMDAMLAKYRTAS